MGKIKYPNFDYYKINRSQTYIYYRKCSPLSNDANLFRKKKKKKKKKKNKCRRFRFLGFSQILITMGRGCQREKDAENRCASTGKAAQFVRLPVSEISAKY